MLGSLNSLNSISALLPSEFPTRAQLTSPASPLHTQQAKVVWMPDADAPRCLSCNKSFFLFRRRHHVRTHILQQMLHTICPAPAFFRGVDVFLMPASQHIIDFYLKSIAASATQAL
jgi:hypothetical protein